jgi:hypothetical protein
LQELAKQARAQPKGGVTVPAGVEGKDWVRAGDEILTNAELDKMAHGKARDADLPGSPPGASGHPNLSRAAEANFGKKSWTHLDADEKWQIIDYLNRHPDRQLPENGELRKK